MNYYISDLHFFHKNVTGEGSNFDNRPFATMEEMHKVIASKWNEKITNADHVYILGDMCWKENEDAISLVATLKGNKHLILGNHDRAKDQRYRQLFNEVCDYKEVNDCIGGKNHCVVLSHFPIAFWNHQHHQAIHLYGHVHSSKEYYIFVNFINDLNAKYGIDCKAYNVGAMMPWMNYTPRTLQEIMGNQSAKHMRVKCR